MKSVFSHLLLIITLSLAISGCMTQLPITRYLPPEIELDSGLTSIQMINSFDYSLVDLGNKKRDALYKLGIDNIVVGLLNSFNPDTIYSIYPFDSTIRGANHFSLPEPFDILSVSGYCKTNTNDMLLLIESFNIEYDKEIEKKEDEDGNESEIAHYYLVVKAGMSLINCNSLQVIDRYEFSREDLIASKEGLILGITFRPSYANKQKEVGKMAYDIGESYIDMFYPSSYIETRSFYSNKEFVPLVPLMLNSAWEEAITFLAPLTESEKKRVAKRACYNMGVIYYVLGDEEQANSWFKTSFEIKTFMSTVPE